MIAFIIWSVVAVLFLLIGISSWKAKEEVGFFTFVGPPKTKDALAYNHAVAKIWFLFAIVFEIIGIPLLFIPQNSPAAVLIAVCTVFLVIAVMAAYVQIEKKYRT